MIDVLSTLQVVLREAGFVTRLGSIDRFPIVSFEDEALMGFGCIFEDPASLLAQWKAVEMSLLRRHAASFRAAGDKAWNVYSILLSAPAGDSVQNRQMSWIEEDLERTRKISGCGLESREDLVHTLLPILPLRYRPTLQGDDATQRLQRRIRTIAPKASGIVLDETVRPADVVRILGEPA